MKKLVSAIAIGFSALLLVASVSTNRVAIYGGFVQNWLSLATNDVAAWPTNAASPGGCLFVNSNSVVYLITSSPDSTTWAATNKLGP